MQFLNLLLANPHATREKYRNHLLDELKGNPDLSIVAEENGTIIGYAQAAVRNDMAVLEDIAIIEVRQKKGVGKRLLVEELKILKSKKAKVVLAEVHYKCSSAIPFYYKYGFRISGFGQDYFGVGHDTIILKMIL